jgi:hypothetical protein
MSKENGFLPLRRGLWEHVRDGRMSRTEALAFIYICSQADTRTGIWKGSAKSLSGELGLPERTARDVLEKMQHGDYIRRFAVPGCHVCYPILVHKFPITQGEHNGEHLNAIESTSPAELSYFPREHSVEQRGEHGAAQRRIEKREERKTPAVRVPPFDSLEQETKAAAFAVFWEKWPRRQAKSDARRAWAKIAIAEYPALMAGLEKWLKSDRWSRGVIPHPARWLNEKRWQDEDIPQFGGINATPTNRNRKPTATDLAIQNARALGLDRPVN